MNWSPASEREQVKQTSFSVASIASVERNAANMKK